MTKHPLLFFLNKWSNHCSIHTVNIFACNSILVFICSSAEILSPGLILHLHLNVLGSFPCGVIISSSLTSPPVLSLFYISQNCVHIQNMISLLLQRSNLCWWLKVPNFWTCLMHSWFLVWWCPLYLPGWAPILLPRWQNILTISRDWHLILWTLLVVSVCLFAHSCMTSELTIFTQFTCYTTLSYLHTTLGRLIEDSLCIQTFCKHHEKASLHLQFYQHIH